MARTYDLVLRGGTVVNHDGAHERDVGIRDGRIAALGGIEPDTGGEEIDVTGLHVLPGVIDSQVHFREPGFPDKEDLEAGSRGAVLGGVTTVFEMPNTNPATTGKLELEEKLAAAKNRMVCDHAFFMGATADNAQDLAELERLPGCCGIKLFMGSSTGDLLVAEDEHIRNVLKHGRSRVAVHSEDEEVLAKSRGEAVAGDPSSHPKARPEEAAVRSTHRVLSIAAETRRRVHILHISTAFEVPLLAGAKSYASMEVTPQHLTFTAADYDELGTRLQMNPPIRDGVHRQALWRAIEDGVVDVLGSDHAPHTLEEKARDYPATPSGMPGVQTLVPVMLDHVAEGRLSLQRFVDLTSTSVQRIFGLRDKGRLAVGWHGDLTVVDLKARHTIKDADMASRCGWTPYDGRTFSGKPVMTIIRGGVVMRDGSLVGEAIGEPASFEHAL
jgi:dihydroorotase